MRRLLWSGAWAEPPTGGFTTTMSGFRFLALTTRDVIQERRQTRTRTGAVGRPVRWYHQLEPHRPCAACSERCGRRTGPVRDQRRATSRATSRIFWSLYSLITCVNRLATRCFEAIPLLLHKCEWRFPAHEMWKIFSCTWTTNYTWSARTRFWLGIHLG